VAAWIRAENASSTVELDVQRFSIVEDGQEYRSVDYDAATNRVEIQLKLAVTSVKII
jgi:hypothetical protein